MRIAIGCDHAGFILKSAVIEAIQIAGHEVVDMGPAIKERVDFPDYAERVGHAIQEGSADRGILICGSGVGMAIAANKMKGIYACLCHDIYSAHQGVEHDNMNVLCLGGLIIGVEVTKELVKAFLGAKHIAENENYARRVGKIQTIEAKS
jgi:ribose 5-phosphate isomerase B